MVRHGSRSPHSLKDRRRIHRVKKKIFGAAQRSMIAITWLFLFLMLTLLLAFTPLTAHADGGAPNLAYVAGTTQGISTIDIGQGKVTGTISVGGDPHSVVLSLDGRFLYVAQPTLGRVTMLAARNGQTICTANMPGQPALLAFDTTPGAN